MADEDEQADLRSKLNAETGKLVWPELEKHFARGVVIKVDPGLDLVEVAACVAEDNKAAVEAWMSTGQLCHPSMEDARDWVERQPDFWAVVVAPWVLVQEVGDRT